MSADAGHNPTTKIDAAVTSAHINGSLPHNELISLCQLLALPPFENLWVGDSVVRKFRAHVANMLLVCKTWKALAMATPRLWSLVY